jgi:hypothetical protein
MQHTKRVFIIDRKEIKVTEKTQDHLMSAKWEDLNLVEKALRSDLERHPDMTWEKAIEMSEMSPL